MRKPGIAKEDSVLNLVKPQLYSIYDRDVVSSTTDYNTLKSLPPVNRKGSRRAKTPFERVINIVFATVVLFIFGVVFAALSSELYDNCTLQRGTLSITLYAISNYVNDHIIVLEHNIVFGILGVLCGFVIPIMDNLFFSKFNYNINSSNDFHAILKGLNSILGISLGIKHLSWKSSMQASVAWGLLNIIMWLYFDGSYSILVVGSMISFVSCSISYSTIAKDDLSLLIYIMDFYFFSLLLFGKLGRYLFKNF